MVIFIQLRRTVEMQDTSDYHGVIVNISQRDKRIYNQLEVLSRRAVIPGILCLYKIKVSPLDLDEPIRKLQENMRNRLFYAHLYRTEELVVVYKQRVFRTTPDKSTWQELIANDACANYKFIGTYEEIDELNISNLQTYY